MRVLSGFVMLFVCSITQAAIYQLTDSQIVGEIQEVEVKAGDSKVTIAREYNLGLDELALANSQVNFKKLKVGDTLKIPTQHILPTGAREGIVINLAEKRMYRFLEGQVATYPVTIGRHGWPTPRINATIVEKKEKPYWHPPASIRAYTLRTKGKKLPNAVPPGPGNPLGEYMMRLSSRKILIHGTNEPNKMGVRLSSGCIRMYPEDIKEVFGFSKVGDTVRIIDVPYKAALQDDKLMIESQLSLDEFWHPKKTKLKAAFMKTVEEAMQGSATPNWSKLDDYIDLRVGYPLTVEDYSH